MLSEDHSPWAMPRETQGLSFRCLWLSSDWPGDPAPRAASCQPCLWGSMITPGHIQRAKGGILLQGFVLAGFLGDRLGKACTYPRQPLFFNEVSEAFGERVHWASTLRMRMGSRHTLQTG